MFSVLLTADEESDYAIEKGLMHVIWARGQEHGNYRHSPDSGIERNVAKDKEFYGKDELKYHGHQHQRGVLTLDLQGKNLIQFIEHTHKLRRHIKT